MTQAFDGDFRHFQEAACCGIGESIWLHDVLCVEDGNREPLLWRMDTVVLGILVPHYVAVALAEVGDRARNLDREQVFVPPRSDTRLPAQHAEQPVLLRDMRRDGDSTLLHHLGEQV